MALLERYRRSVASKVLIPQIVVIIVSLIIVVLVAVIGIDGLKQQTIENEVHLIKSRLTTFIDMRKTVLLVGTASLSKDTLIADAIENGDNAALQQLINNQKDNVINEVLRMTNKEAKGTTTRIQVINKNGVIVASTSEKNADGVISQAVGENVSDSWAFRKISAKSGFVSTIDYDKQGIILRALAPIVKNGEMIGALQMVEDLRDTVDNFVKSNGFIYMLNLSPKFNSYAKNVKGSLYYNDGLVINSDDIDIKLLDVIKAYASFSP